MIHPWLLLRHRRSGNFFVFVAFFHQKTKEMSVFSSLAKDVFPKACYGLFLGSVLRSVLGRWQSGSW